MISKKLNPRNQTSINQKFREKRFKFFLSLFENIKSDKPVRILDIGGEESYWERMNFVQNNEDVHITLLNLTQVPTKYPNLLSIKGDACDLSEFKDKEFDIVFSNSVIEHLYTKENQQKMANDAIRIGKNYYVQTPNYYFPIEPHWIFPGFQFLPFNTRVFLTHHFALGNFSKITNKNEAKRLVSEISLLTEKEMKALFPGGKVYREMFMGFKKSVAMYQFTGN